MTAEAPQNLCGQGSASGKVILFGEHAVVYGVPAIAAGLSRGCTTTATRSPEDVLYFGDKRLEPDHELYVALARLRQNLVLAPAEVRLQVEIPTGAGLGSSASMAVATARALTDLRCKLEENDGTRKRPTPSPSARQLFEAAQTWERVFHGNPSGVDVSAAAQAGIIRYLKGEEPERLVMGAPLHLAVAQAGPPASTKMMVDGVAKLKKRNPTQFDRTLEAIAALVQNAQLLLRQGDLKAVGKLMDLNQMLLAGWMLSTEEIETACRRARNAGALGAKLTGAGGGGCVIALADSPEGADTILEAWKKAGLLCFTATVGQDDVKAGEHDHGACQHNHEHHD